MRCGEGGWTTSVGGLLCGSLARRSTAAEVGLDEGVPTDPYAVAGDDEACVSAGEGRSVPAWNRAVRGDDSGLLNAIAAAAAASYEGVAW